MMRRRDFAAAGLSAVTLAAMQSRSLAQEPKRSRAEAGHGEHHEAFQACAEACSDCQRACDACGTHCAHALLDGGDNHIVTLMSCEDCADICACASQCCARGGPYAALICASCAEACAKCGEECEKFPDDEHMAACAKECRKCEKACRAMVEHAGHGDHSPLSEGKSAKRPK